MHNNKMQAVKLEEDIFNDEAEIAVIATCIWYEGFIDRAMNILHDEKSFYIVKNQLLYKALMELRKDNVPIDAVTISERFNKLTNNHSKLKDVEPARIKLIYGHKRLNKDDVEKFEYYCNILVGTQVQRIMLRKTKELFAYSQTSADPNEILGHAHHLISDISKVLPRRETSAEEEIDRARRMIFSEDQVIPFGYKAYDDSAGGMTRGEFSILGGRPGHGKTTSVVNIAKRLADQGRRVVVFNREMTNTQMLYKLAVMDSEFSMSDIRATDMNDSTKKRWLARVEEVAHKYDGKIIMFDKPMDIYTSMSVLRQVKPDVAIDDFLQLWSVPGVTERRHQIGEGLRYYKNVCKELNMSALICSQLNRNIESRFDNPYPQMSDLAESGEIEQLAENVLFTFYDYKINYEESEKGKNCLELVASKVRYGETGIYDIGFDGNNCLITDRVSDARTKQSQIAGEKHESPFA